MLDADTAKFTQFLKDLDEFDTEGRAYGEVYGELKKVKSLLTGLKNSGNIDDAVENAFSEARRDAALWVKTTKEADKAVRDVCGEVWKTGAAAEKEAVYNYTRGSGRFNRPLSGFKKPYSKSGSGWEAKYFKGAGKVWIDYEGAGDAIRQMTGLAGRSKYDFDMWLQRGSDHGALESHLNLGLSKMTEGELQKLVGKEFTNHAFTSTAVNKGSGFSGDIIWNIYAPKGTQMMYAEPYSAFGGGSAGMKWNGVSKQKDFGHEAEMIIQRGATFRITKIEKKGWQLFMDVEVRPEKGYKLIQQDPAEWKGRKDKFK